MPQLRRIGRKSRRNGFSGRYGGDLVSAHLVHQDNRKGYYFPSANPDRLTVKDELERLIGGFETGRSVPPAIGTEILQTLIGGHNDTVSMLLDRQSGHDVPMKTEALQPE
jgi:hypothetical protein